MAASRLLLRSSALGLCLALSAPAWGAEDPLASIMNPSIMSQMVMLDEAPSSSAVGPVNDTAAEVTSAVAESAPVSHVTETSQPMDTVQNAADAAAQAQAPDAQAAAPSPPSPPQPVAEQMSTLIPEPADAPQAKPPAAPAPEPAPKETAKKAETPKDYTLQPKPEKGKSLTLEEVIAMAIKNSPERDIAAQQVVQAKSAVDEARSNYFPQVSVRAEAGREFNDPFAITTGATNRSGYNYANNTTLNMRQMLYDGFITRETVQQRMQLVESSQLSKAKITEELIKSTTEVYMELYQYQQVVAASAENLAALRDIAKLIDIRLKAGDASKAEKNYMQARVAAAEQSYITSQAALKDAFSALTYLIGPVEEFDAVPPSLSEYMTSDPDEIIQKAVTKSTDIRIVDSDQKAAEHDLSAAKGRFMPELDLVLDGNHGEDLGGDSGTRDFGSAKVQVSYKIFDGGLRSATTQRQQAKIREVEARQNRVKREITQNVKRDYNKQQTAVKELQVAEQEIVANTELEVLYRKQFKSGDIDISNLVESQERIFSARMKKYKLESDMVNVTFALLRSTAEILPKFCGNTTGC